MMIVVETGIFLGGVEDESFHRWLLVLNAPGFRSGPSLHFRSTAKALDDGICTLHSLVKAPNARGLG